MPSIAAIAKQAGVSKSTVWLVLNNRANVTEAMRQRVTQALDVLQRSDSPLTGPATHATKILLIHPISLGSQQVFRELLQGVQDGIVQAQGQLTLAVNQPPLHPEHATHALLHDRAFRPNGVIIMGARRDDPIFDEVRRENIPCVLLARQEAPEDMCAVGMDNTEGVRQATEYLIRLGHRRIAFLGGDPNYDYTEERLAGYRLALEQNQLAGEELAFSGTGDEATRAFLQARTGATAVLYTYDEQTFRGLPVLAEAGVRVPDDLSVISFDDTDKCARYDPPLTAVSVPRRLIGLWAAKTVWDCIHQPEMKRVRVILHTRLNIRGSCRPLGI